MDDNNCQVQYFMHKIPEENTSKAFIKYAPRFN